MTPKIVVMELSEDHKPRDEIFSFHDGEGKYYHFNCSAINRAIQRRAIPSMFVKTEVNAELTDHIKTHNGYEPGKVIKLLDNPDAVAQPILVVEWPDGRHTLVDGNHRFVLHHALGMRAIGANIVKFTDCDPYMVGFPEELGPIFTAQD